MGKKKGGKKEKKDAGEKKAGDEGVRFLVHFKG